MEEKHLVWICIALTLISMAILVFTYKPDFEEKTLLEITANQNMKGKVYGKVEYVVKNYPVTIFVLTDGKTSATVYYPKATSLEENNFVTGYLENQGQKNLFAQKVVKE